MNACYGFLDGQYGSEIWAALHAIMWPLVLSLVGGDSVEPAQYNARLFRQWNSWTGDAASSAALTTSAGFGLFRTGYALEARK